MKYEQIWKKVLTPTEQVKYEFSVGDSYRKYGTIVWGLASLFFAFMLWAMRAPVWIGPSLVLLVIMYYQYYVAEANAFAFTDKRVIIHRGLLSSRTITIDYGKITDVTVDEPFLDQFLKKSGTLIINTAGTSKYEVVLKNIQSPYEIKKKLDELRG